MQAADDPFELPPLFDVPLEDAKGGGARQALISRLDPGGTVASVAPRSRARLINQSSSIDPVAPVDPISPAGRVAHVPATLPITIIRRGFHSRRE
jgi:hypothetical protein